MRLGEIIKEYRQANLINQTDFANRCRCTRAYISLLEKGFDPRNGKPLRPSIQFCITAANAMGMELVELSNRMGDDGIVELQMVTENLNAQELHLVETMRKLFPEQQNQLISFAEFLAKTQSNTKDTTVTSALAGA